jgi:hypothetical protein
VSAVLLMGVVVMAALAVAVWRDPREFGRPVTRRGAAPMLALLVVSAAVLAGLAVWS